MEALVCRYSGNKICNVYMSTYDILEFTIALTEHLRQITP